MTDLRPEEAIAFGYIPCRFEGETKLLRTRKLASAREWKGKFARSIGGTIAEFNVPGRGGADSIEGIAKLGNLGSDLILDLVLDYDARGDLGGREWLEEHADDREVYTVLRAVLDVHFPFVKDVMGAMRELGRIMGETPSGPPLPSLPTPDVPSETESSSSGASPNGDSDPTTSKRGSTKAS